MTTYNTSLAATEMRFVYFLRPVGGGPVKIGCSHAPGKRFQFFAEWSPVPMELLGQAPGHVACAATINHRFTRSLKVSA